MRKTIKPANDPKKFPESPSKLTSSTNLLQDKIREFKTFSTLKGELEGISKPLKRPKNNSENDALQNSDPSNDQD